MSADDDDERPRDRNVYGLTRRKTPPFGSTDFEREEVTGVGTDPQVFRSVKKLRAELKESETRTMNAVGEVKKDVKGLDEKVDKIVESHATVVGELKGINLALTRPRTVSEDVHLVRTTTNATLTVEKTKFKHALALKIAGGVFSVGGLGALVHWLLGKL